jgi:hypothetical protein
MMGPLEDGGPASSYKGKGKWLEVTGLSKSLGAAGMGKWELERELELGRSESRRVRLGRCPRALRVVGSQTISCLSLRLERDGKRERERESVGGGVT